MSTSWRACPVAQTLAVAQRLAARLDIKDCSDASGRDVLGVPVWFSQREASTGRRIHSGKGLLPIEAQVGALMEAIEISAASMAGARFAGERTTLGDLVAAFDPTLAVADLAPRLNVAMPAARSVAVETCEDIFTGTVYRLPAELLHLGLPKVDDAELVFGMSSNGLASGNSLEEATLHALLEVLERDAVALNLARPSAQHLALATLPEPFATLNERWLMLGVEMRLRVLQSVADVPCIEAELLDRSAKPAPDGLGFGLHPDPLIALSRAVTEAAQSRLYQICHGEGSPHGLDRAIEAAPKPAAPGLNFVDLQSMGCNTIAQALVEIALRLRAQGLPWVLRRRLNLKEDCADLDGLHVVKVVVPGCESLVGSNVRIGRRMARRLSGLDRMDPGKSQGIGQTAG